MSERKEKKPRRSVRQVGPYGARSYQMSRALVSRDEMVRAARGLNRASRGLQLARGEWKSVDVTGTAVLDSTGAVVLLNGIARGDDIGERTGREVVMRSIQFNGVCAATDVTGAEATCRVVIVYDRQANAAAPTAAQVLVANNTYAPRNLENRRRFKILYDETFGVGDRITGVANPGADFAHYIRWYRKLNHPVTFNSGDAGTIADITSGSVYMLTVSTQGAGATAGSIYYYCRIRFEDK